MKLEINPFAGVLGVLFATACTALAQNQMVPSPTPTMPALDSDTHYGLFNWLDHRSSYGQGVFPEPFLVDDSDLEVNEARLDWVHTTARDQRNDEATAEVEKGFGALTLEVELHYERDVEAGDVASGIGNIDVGARYPLHQYVAANGSFDNTVGVGFEAGIPVNSIVSKNGELVPKVFDDLRLGDHFTLQSIFGYSTLLGGGDEGGLDTFEYGFDFGYTITHQQLPIPGVQQLIPVFELAGETELNKADPGHNSLLGDIALRVNLKAIHGIQPRLGIGFVFPMDEGARADVHCGVVTSLVFEY